MDKTRQLIAKTERFVASNYHPLEVVVVRGEGCFVWDVEGRRYFDLLSAYSAVGQGHCHPRIVAALCEQARRLTLPSRAFHNDRLSELAERLSQLTGYEQMLPMNTGAEAVETAVKAMRRFGYRRGIPEGRAEIVVASGNFHGRTTTLVSFSDEPLYARGFGPPTPGFRVVPWDDPGALEEALGPRTAGVLLEPIQGEAGVRIPRKGYLAGVRRACSRVDALLCFDEVQTGLGRTGKLFAWQHEDARPDLLVLGKALSGGVYPVSCVCADHSVLSVFEPGSHGSTFGGNPLGAAVALAALEVIVDEGLVERAATLGAHALGRLRALRAPSLKEVRGRGLMLAVEYTRPVAADVARALAEVGVLAKDTRGTTIRLLPPLNITEQQLDEALELALPVLASF